MSYLTTFCWDCDAVVRVTSMGWYSCSHCGYESLRVSPATPPDVFDDLLEAVQDARRAQPGAGLVCLSIKGEIL